jgi:hypothetical protein
VSAAAVSSTSTVPATAAAVPSAAAASTTVESSASTGAAMSKPVPVEVVSAVMSAMAAAPKEDVAFVVAVSATIAVPAAIGANIWPGAALREQRDRGESREFQCLELCHIALKQKVLREGLRTLLVGDAESAFILEILSALRG